MEFGINRYYGQLSAKFLIPKKRKHVPRYQAKYQIPKPGQYTYSYILNFK